MKPILYLSLAILFDKNATAWTITPKLSLKETYSDNIGLSPLAQSAWVTELTPGLMIKRDNEKNKFDLNYRLQNFFYLGIDKNPNLFNQLQMNSKTELSESLFLDSSSSIGQMNTNSMGAIALDNSSIQSNTTEFRTFRLSPYWKAHLGAYATGEARLGYDQVNNSGGVNIGSNIYQQSLNFKNGPASGSFNWKLKLNHQDIQRTEDDSNLSYLNYHTEVGYKLTPHYRIFIQAGCYDNDFKTLINSAQNGCYEILGAAYMPHPKLNLSAGIGINQNFASLNWNPNSRTQLQIIYRDSQVGGVDQNTLSSSNTNNLDSLGGANVGSSWNGFLEYHTPKIILNASYTTSVTTIQQLLLESQVFKSATDPTSNSRPIDLPSLTNEVITRKRGQLSITGSLPKSRLNLSLYQENRNFQNSSNQPQDILGLMVALNWKFYRKTQATLQANWQRIDQTNLASSNELSSIMLLISHQVSPDLNMNLELRHMQQDSNLAISKFIENRATASLNISF